MARRTSQSAATGSTIARLFPLPSREGPRPSPHDVVGTNPLEHNIATAHALELVDRSSAALIYRLNERAKMINPAWFLYALGAVALVWGVSLVVNGTTPLETPSLPDVTAPLSAGRKVNQTDEYSLLLARYGEPNTVLVTLSRSIRLRTAVYDATRVRVVFGATRILGQDLGGLSQFGADVSPRQGRWFGTRVP